MEVSFGGVQISTAWALAIVVALAYVLGRCGRRGTNVSKERQMEMERELRRAQLAATRLEKIVSTTRASLKKHQSRLRGFKSRIIKLKGQQRDDLSEKLGREIEAVLDPTIHLAAQIASAHDVMRYETSVLMTFTDSQTDPLTGVCNRRGLDHSLEIQFAYMNRYDSRFSLLLLDIDNFKNINDRQGHLHGDEMLREVAHFLEQEAREVDMVARYGGDEFIIVMPQTPLKGAIVLAERLRRKIEQTMAITVSGGVAAAEKGDTPVALFLRVDSALYAAKGAGRNRVFWHDGEAAKAVTNPSSLVAMPVNGTPVCEAVE
jgi:diguanylate cyclase (GGDEF)-like protein